MRAHCTHIPRSELPDNALSTKVEHCISALGTRLHKASIEALLARGVKNLRLPPQINISLVDLSATFDIQSGLVVDDVDHSGDRVLEINQAGKLRLVDIATERLHNVILHPFKLFMFRIFFILPH